ncbi:MAG: GspMb/PilO family protein [bacterium]
MADAIRPQDRRALVIGAILLAGMFGYALVLRPAVDRLRLDRVSLLEQQSLLARERALLVTAPGLPQARRAVDRVLATASSRLFSGDSIAATAAFATQASNIARATGVRLSTVEGRPSTTDRGVTRLLVDVHGEGNWREILTFVHVLESSAQLVDITNLRIERGPRGGPLGGDALTLSATLAGYGRGGP